jgi:hypothetical protein
MTQRSRMCSCVPSRICPCSDAMHSGSCSIIATGRILSTTKAGGGTTMPFPRCKRPCRRSVPLAGRLAAPGGWLCQGRNALLRIPLGRLFASPHWTQDRPIRIRESPGQGPASEPDDSCGVSAGLGRCQSAIMPTRYGTAPPSQRCHPLPRRLSSDHVSSGRYSIGPDF